MVDFEGHTCIFKSVPEFYDKEVLGDKPCTVRLVSPAEATALTVCNKIKIYLKPFPCWYFERKITDFSRVGELAGKTLVVISWAHPWGRPDEV